MNREEVLRERVVDPDDRIGKYAGTVNEAYLPKPHAVTITPLDYGYTAQVGCKVFAFESRQDMISYLSEYLSNPEGMSKRYYAGELFNNNKQDA